MDNNNPGQWTSPLTALLTTKYRGYDVTECTVPIFFVQCPRGCGWSEWSRKSDIDEWINSHEKSCPTASKKAAAAEEAEPPKRKAS